jgi:hypothetical protein
LKKQKIINKRDWLIPEKRKKEIQEKIHKAGYTELDLIRLKQKSGIDIVALLSDKDRIDFLQALTNKKLYSGRVILRISTTGRGWRLHETSNSDGIHSVRKAIDFFMKFEGEKEGGRKNE